MSFSEKLQLMALPFPQSRHAELARFLKARKEDVKLATRMYEIFLEWRRVTFPIHLTDTVHELLRRRVFYQLPGLAADGSSIVVFHGPNHAPTKFSTEETMQSIVWVTMGVLSSRLDDPRITILIFAPAGTPFDLKGLAALSSTFSNYFPETLSKAIVFPVGGFTPYLWRAAKVFLDPVTADKVVLMQGRDPELAAFIPVENTPSRFLPNEMKHGKPENEPALLPILDRVPLSSTNCSDGDLYDCFVFGFKNKACLDLELSAEIDFSPATPVSSSSMPGPTTSADTGGATSVSILSNPLLTPSHTTMSPDKKKGVRNVLLYEFIFVFIATVTLAWLASKIMPLEKDLPST
mmetsp:Transcript_38328/g.75652  ORF Transcript_38328/g.75652 Transcript_38328/m.75652 type:complete len:350 (+) Transcript_38328:137-1186(+)